MKFQNVKLPAFIVISVISFSAFIFLNTVKSNQGTLQQLGIQSSSLDVEDVDQDEETKKFNSDYFPEISVVKRAFELMRKYIPAS